MDPRLRKRSSETYEEWCRRCDYVKMERLALHYSSELSYAEMRLKTLDSEKEANAILTDENERLRKMLEEAYSIIREYAPKNVLDNLETV